jgi:pimeloyl-ACP methyl ester carboxylesterase
MHAIFKKTALAAAALAPLLAHAGIPETVTSGAKNVVLVPGAWVDGSSWRQMHDQLWLKGYKVTVVQQPNTTLDENVAAVRRAIEAQDGPVVLVGHDVSGATISIAGQDDKVKALVYVAALQPERGESAAQLLSSVPASDKLAQATRTTRDGHVSLDPASFPALYAGDLPPNRTNFMKVAQVPSTRALLDTPAWAAAWHAKPVYAIVATEDQIVDAGLQRLMYHRANAKVTEIKASHALMISQPEAVLKVVRQAALDVK